MFTACKEVRFLNGQPDGEAFRTFPGAEQGCFCHSLPPALLALEWFRHLPLQQLTPPEPGSGLTG